VLRPFDDCQALKARNNGRFLTRDNTNNLIPRLQRSKEKRLRIYFVDVANSVTHGSAMLMRGSLRLAVCATLKTQAVCDRQVLRPASGKSETCRASAWPSHG